MRAGLALMRVRLNWGPHSMRIVIIGGVSLLALLVSACGGSETGSSPPTQIPSTPSPSPTPTPSPTPAPTSSDPTLLTLNATTQLVGFQGDSGYVRSNGGVITYATNISSGPGTVVIYDSTTRGLTYLASGFGLFGMPDFGNVSLRSDNRSSTSSFMAYSGSANGVSLRLQQLRMGATNPELPLYYSSIAYARSTYRNPSSGEMLNGIVPFSFGILYDEQVYRPTGVASYEGLIVGHARGDAGANAYDISGRIRLNVNYDTTEVTGYVELVGKNDVTGEAVSFGRMNILASRRTALSSISSGFELTSSRFQAFFAGREAQEVMGAFDTSLADPKSTQPMRATGAFAGKK